MYNINIWSILVSAVVSFGIGALWYSPILFGKEWMALMKMNEANITDSDRHGMWKSYLIHFVFTVISFCVLAFLITATGAPRGSDGAFLGLILWLGFIVPINVSELVWARAPFKLVVINTTNTLVSLVIGGAIIGAW